MFFNIEKNKNLKRSRTL